MKKIILVMCALFVVSIFLIVFVDSNKSKVVDVHQSNDNLYVDENYIYEPQSSKEELELAELEKKDYKANDSINASTDVDLEQENDNSNSADGIKTISLNELGTLTLNGLSYVDDGNIYYSNYTNTYHYIGYNLNQDQINSLIEFDVYFEQFADPTSYFSFVLRASDVGSVHSSFLEQNGYAFVIHPNGEMQVYKNFTQLIWKYDSPIFTSGSRYSFKVGAIEVDNNIRLILEVNDVVVYDQLDTENPLLDNGTYFNISSLIGNSSGVVAQFIPTTEFVCPYYKTYTMSTLGNYPIRSGKVVTDKYNNLTFSSGLDTAGYNVNLQNYSLEFNINFESFPVQTAFYVALRASEYARANGSHFGGYSIGLSKQCFYVFKVGKAMLAQVPFSFEEHVDYDIEFGAVDFNSSKTMLFVNINGKTVYISYDSDAPSQQRGMILITCEGDINCNVTSAYTRLNPLKTKVEESSDYKSYNVYFDNSFTNEELDYSNISIRNLRAIQINGISVYELNNMYYGKKFDDKAIDISCSDNVLTIKISKIIHLKVTNEEVNLICEYLKLQKTSENQGLKSNTIYALRQSYFYCIN